MKKYKIVNNRRVDDGEIVPKEEWSIYEPLHSYINNQQKRNKIILGNYIYLFKLNIIKRTQFIIYIIFFTIKKKINKKIT